MPDFHIHACGCGASFSHHKSRIALGMGPDCHLCPVCRKPVNERLELGQFEGKPQYPEYYGLDNIGAKVNPETTRRVAKKRKR